MSKPTDQIRLPRYIVQRLISLMRDPKGKELQLKMEATQLQRTLDERT